MKYNLSFLDIAIRYFLLMILGIIGGLLAAPLLMVLLVLPVFLTAILGWCPVYQLLGIDHSFKGMNAEETELKIVEKHATPPDQAHEEQVRMTTNSALPKYVIK